MPEAPHKPLQRLGLIAWILMAGLALYLYYSRPDFFGDGMRSAAGFSIFAVYALYFVLIAVRGLTLIPATGLLVLAIPFIPPIPLFVLTLLGMLISAAIIYYFSGSLGLAEYFERNHKGKIDTVRTLLQRNPTTIVIAWSFFPLAPTDLICYVCGIMRIRFSRFMLGVFIGESMLTGIYVFLGDHLMRLLHWRI
jgi:uncharacterized membrane protein YdjX (TVP38/TMEM64 family)